MERHKCKLCFKMFANGRALGGHMRSHMLNLPIPVKPDDPNNQASEETELLAACLSSQSSSDEEGGEEKGVYYGLRENPKRSIRMVDPEFSFAVDAGSVVLQDRESETESSKNPTRRRSKRARKSGTVLEHHQYHHHHGYQHNERQLKFQKLSKAESSWGVEPEPVSSVSDTTTEKDVAFCLMMLSRGAKWKRMEDKQDDQEQEQQDEPEKSIEETDESDELFKSCKVRSSRVKYKCETCKKVFKSYQALGGHRASHKKVKVSTPRQEPEVETENAAGTPASGTEKKVHECPYCFRVFSSGQALGGHKRSHVTGVAAAAAAAAPPPPPPLPPPTLTTSSTKFGESLIDLNLPAPMEDDDLSQIELSAVSDGEFVNHIKR